MTAPKVEVTSADIARIAGVGPNAVSNWRKRHEDFPAPVGGTDRSPVFLLGEVQEWLAQQGKAVRLSADQSLWQAFESTRAAMSPADAFSLVGILLLYLRRHPRTTLPVDHAGFTKLMERAEHSWLTEGRLVPGLLDALGTGGLGARQATLLHAAAQAAGADGAERAFEALCERVLDAGSRSGFAPTPRQLAELMLDLAGPSPARGSLLDPACGTGSILLAAADRGYARVEGQEIDRSTARVALLRLAFRAARAETEEDEEEREEGTHKKPVGYDVHIGDSFHSDAFKGREFSAVVTNPPFAVRTWWDDSLLHDPRWVYGIPARIDSELAWTQHALAHAAAGAPVVLLMPPGAGSRPSGRRIRGELVRLGALRAVIALPPRLAASYALSLQIWVLRRPEGRGRLPARLLMVDTAAGEPGLTPGRSPRRESVSWDRVRTEIMDAWSAFAADPVGFAERPGVARAVPAAELLDDEVDFTPRRYLPVAQEAAVAPQELEDGRAAVADHLNSLSRLLSELASLPAGSVRSRLGADPGPVRLVSIDELAKAGGVFLRRSVTSTATQDAEAGSGEAEQVRALTARDLVLGQPPSELMTVVADPVHNPPIREGDVLIPAFGRRLTARVATEDDLGAHPSAGVYVLRPDTAIVDPWFLAGFLSSVDGSRQAIRVTGTVGEQARFDPRKVRVPLPPIEVQRTYGEMLERLSQFGLALRATHDLGWKLVGQMTDVLMADFAAAGKTRVQ